MNLQEFKFPKLTGADIAFPTIGADKELLQEAELRSREISQYKRLFSNLFFKGGKLHFKEGLNEQFKLSALPYLKALMGSFEPKHQDKEAVCALLLSELVDITKYDL